MPIYEYKCSDCGNKFEVLQSNIKKTPCSACGGKARPILSVFRAPGTQKQWIGKNEVNFDVDTPKQEIEKQLAASASAGKFSGSVKPHIRRERIMVGEEALRTAPDVRGIE